MNFNKYVNQSELVGAQNIYPLDVSNQPITKMSLLNKAINNFIIDNNMLYKKLIDLETEIKNLRISIGNIKYPQQILYTK